MKRDALSLATAFALTGCFLPGAQLQAGQSVATSTGDLDPQLRIGVHPPLPITSRQDERRIDMGVGYWQDGIADAKYGAYGAFTAFPLVAEGDRDTMRRLGIGAQIRVAEHGQQAGWAAAAQVTGDVGFFGHASNANGVIAGVATIGLYVEAAYEQVGRLETVTVGAGVLLRLPLIAGLTSFGRGHR